MEGAGIYDSDILVIDRSLVPQENDVVIAVVNSELTVKRLIMDSHNNPVLHPENPTYPDIPLYFEEDLTIWGVVTGNFHWQCPRIQAKSQERVVNNDFNDEQ